MINPAGDMPGFGRYAADPSVRRRAWRRRPSLGSCGDQYGLRRGPTSRRLPVRPGFPRGAHRDRRHGPTPGGERTRPGDNSSGGAGGRRGWRVVRALYRTTVRSVHHLQLVRRRGDWACRRGDLGAVFGAIAHAATRGQRDFRSSSTLQAREYDVTVDPSHADQARQLLQRLNWQSSGAG